MFCKKKYYSVEPVRFNDSFNSKWMNCCCNKIENANVVSNSNKLIAYNSKVSYEEIRNDMFSFNLFSKQTYSYYYYNVWLNGIMNRPLSSFFFLTVRFIFVVFVFLFTSFMLLFFIFCLWKHYVRELFLDDSFIYYFSHIGLILVLFSPVYIYITYILIVRIIIYILIYINIILFFFCRIFVKLMFFYLKIFILYLVIPFLNVIMKIMMTLTFKYIVWIISNVIFVFVILLEWSIVYLIYFVPILIRDIGFILSLWPSTKSLKEKIYVFCKSILLSITNFLRRKFLYSFKVEIQYPYDKHYSIWLKLSEFYENYLDVYLQGGGNSSHIVLDPIDGRLSKRGVVISKLINVVMYLSIIKPLEQILLKDFILILYKVETRINISLLSLKGSLLFFKFRKKKINFLI